MKQRNNQKFYNSIALHNKTNSFWPLTLTMEHWQEVAVKTTVGQVEFQSTNNVTLSHGSFVICEGGTISLTSTALIYKPPAATIKWSMNFKSIEALKREASGYLSSGKIYFQVASGPASIALATDTSLLTWQCQVCDEINESPRGSSSHSCKLCGSLQKGKLLEIKIDAKPPAEEEMPLLIVNTSWVCQVCEDTNEGGNFCSSCGFKRSPSVNNNRWICVSCTFENDFEADSCQICETPKDKPVVVVEAATPKSWYKLSFKSGGSTLFYDKLKRFREESIRAAALSSEETESLTVGVAGLFKRHEEKSLAAEASLTTAFTDLDALMRSAGEMVTLASKISDKLARKGTTEADELSSGDRTAFVALVESLGIEAIEDEEVCGDKTGGGGGALEFYDSIARGVSSLVQSLIVKTGGVRVYSLADIYCIYNRTRTTGSLIAPADLLKGARRLARLDLPVRLHKFTGKGTLCLVPAQDVDPHQLYSLITQILTERGEFLTAVDLAEKLKISLLLAGQQLAMAEAAGKVVRDGQRKEHHLPAFYPNKILNFEINS